MATQAGEVPDDDTSAVIGKAAVTRPGNDLTLIGYSRMAYVATESVKKTHSAVILEDDWLTYGIGAEIAASISDGAFDYPDAPVRRVAMAEVPLPYGKPLEPDRS